VNKILVATDGSVPSENALMEAAEQASKGNASLEIMTVILDISPMASPIEGYPYPYRIHDSEEVTEYHQRILNYSVRKVKEVYPDLDINTHLRAGRPSKEIVDLAEELGCSMVVLGSRGIGGITGWVLGSTCKKVVDQCQRKVLIVK